MIDLDLTHGQRYHVCIYANATDAVFETFTQPLSAVDACSNGILVDRQPPERGTVWVGGHDEEWTVQVRIE